MTAVDPIAAVATPPGRGGIGVVRVSGPDLSVIIDALVGRPLTPRLATYGPFRAADGSVIDQGLAIHFPAPHSYTGEQVLELQGHGGPVVMQMLLARVLEAGRVIGVRLARPGEFTERAFLNDKLDLAQAEAVADLIDAATEQAARSATRSLAGEFSSAVRALVEALIDLRMLVEATLDFPEEEIDHLRAGDADGRLHRVRSMLADVLVRARQGALLREGLNVVLIGRPNVGKSSLLNALAGAEVAIVTAIPGTTRDKVTQAIQIDGVPLHVIDTAGLRETTDEVERIGIERTWTEIDRADVIVHLQEARAGSDEPDAIDRAIASRLPPRVPVLEVFNKIDVAGVPARVDGQRAVWLSAKTGDGVGLLRHTLLALAGWQVGGEGLFLARERHLHALRIAQLHLDNADERAAQGSEELELLAEELRLAQEQLNLITGEFGADDLLGVIFSRFCIGK